MGPVASRAMPDRFSDRSPDRTSEDDLRAHAAFRAGKSESGIGAAVARSEQVANQHVWECIVSDGEEWHFIRVLGVDIGPFPDLVSEDIEGGIEQFAAALPPANRLGALLNSNPLHVSQSGTVSG